MKLYEKLYENNYENFHYQQQCFVTLRCASLILSVHLMISKNFEKSKD